MKTRRIGKITKRLLAVVLALSLFVTSAVLAQQAKLVELNQQAMKLHQDGKYSDATKIVEEALRLAENTFGPDDPNVALSLNHLALLHEIQRKYSEAEPLFKRSLE